MIADKSLETQSNCTLKASEMNSNLVTPKYMISLNSRDWSLWGQSPVLGMLRTEKEMLRGGEGKASFFMSEKERRRKGEEKMEVRDICLIKHRWLGYLQHH